MQLATYKRAINQRVTKSVLLSILYLFIILLIEFLNYELSTIFTIYTVLQTGLGDPSSDVLSFSTSVLV